MTMRLRMLFRDRVSRSLLPNLGVALGALSLVSAAPLPAAAQAPIPDACITDTSATPLGEARVFQCTGDEVRFSVAIPPRCASRAGCGLIVDLPGATQTAESVNQESGLRTRARDLPFIVVNAERPVPGEAPRFAAGSADEVFAFMQRAIRVFALDTKRVHIGGFSQGGGITFSILCDPSKAPLIASAAPAASVSRNARCFGASGFNPDADILYMSGTRDTIANFETQMATATRIVDGLAPVASTVQIDSGPNGFEQTRITAADGRVLELIRYDSANARLGGHCFVGPAVPNGGGCNPPTPFEYGEKILEFYLANPRGE